MYFLVLHLSAPAQAHVVTTPAIAIAPVAAIETAIELAMIVGARGVVDALLVVCAGNWSSNASSC